MRALVTGANGFIGRALIARLEADGADVRRVVRGAPEHGQASLNIARREFDTSQLPGNGLNDVDVIFHLSGEPITPIRWSPQKRERIRSSRVTSTDVIARAIARTEQPPSTWVCGSAIGIYGDRGSTLLDEDSSAGTGFLAEVCRAWEGAAAPAKEVGTRVVHAGTGIVLGAGGGVLAAQLPLFRLGLGGRLGDGHQWTSWISLDDEVSALVELAYNDVFSGPCNLTAPNPVTNAQYTASLAAVLHRPAFLAVPRRALRLLTGRTVTNDVLLASQRVLPRRLAQTEFVFRHPRIEDALGHALQSSPRRRVERSTAP